MNSASDCWADSPSARAREKLATTPWFLRTHPLDDVRIQQLKQWLPRAKAEYDVAKAKCGVHGNGRKAECLTSARTAKARAFADAKLASL